MKNGGKGEEMQIWDKFSFLNKYFALKVPYTKEVPEDLEISLC